MPYPTDCLIVRAQSVARSAKRDGQDILEAKQRVLEVIDNEDLVTEILNYVYLGIEP